MIFIYVIDLHEEAPMMRKRTVQERGETQRTISTGGATPKGRFPFPLMSKGEREISEA
jgi:hypothetical protein